MLNAAFLGGLTAEDQFLLAFGNKGHFHPDFRRRVRHEAFQRWQDSLLKKKIVTDETARRIAARFRRMIG
jgi:hypothetical protein